jgi:raffinose/stachyose/melibiose transport system permease protein
MTTNVNRSGLFVYYRWLFLVAAASLCLFPLWAAVIGGFKSTGDLRTNAFGLPRQWLADNYISIVTSVRFWQMLGNSAFIACVSVVLTLLVSSMAAFVLAHLRFAGKRWLANYLALGLTFPFATAVLPVFIRVRDLGLLDTYWGVILPQVAFNLGFAIVLLQVFFRNCPRNSSKQPLWTVAIIPAFSGRSLCRCRARSWPRWVSLHWWAVGTDFCCRW